ncbi:hypothetical protein [Bradyrhizobium elkanii]|uniref:hypothetical protein n=1 Tax=Bradyrhizobium elkanii TaxID=29448 RepID=UPI001BAE50B1|nr:hypothetical protein [Bradyrhizobium elkanii]MBR1162622.1 hypothetical protein [Bradyrhizobium elkanii]
MPWIAAPMIGGMIFSILLTLIVIPAIFAVVKGVEIKARVSAPEVASCAARQAAKM